MAFIQTEKFVHYTRQGQGSPVLCIHGLAASLYDWKDMLPALGEAGYTGYALDLLGHGESYKPAALAEYSLDNVYRHFTDWVDSLGLTEPAVLVGHSLGGWIALEYARLCPDKVRALVLVDPFYSLDQLPGLLKLHYRRPLFNPQIIEHAPTWIFRIAIDITSLSIRNGYVLDAETRSQTAEDYKRAAPGIFNIPQAMRDFTPDLPHIPHPALVIWGSRDQTLAPDSFPRLVEALPNARGQSIPAGHVPHQSNAREVNEMVIEFLKQK
jgi:3-oxoadipate enol-lactonase